MKLNKMDWIWGAMVLVVSVVATGGSLYFSEVMGFIPCVLCWYQRILMYPLVVISGVSVIRKDKDFWKYVLPMSLLGMCIALYHVYLESFAVNTESTLCTHSGVPCTVKYINWFGFITIPVLSLTAFTLINGIILTKLVLERRKTRRKAE